MVHIHSPKLYVANSHLELELDLELEVGKTICYGKLFHVHQGNCPKQYIRGCGIPASNHCLKLVIARKYPLPGYILGVLTHTTAWDRHWGGDETLKLVLVYVAWLLLP